MDNDKKAPRQRQGKRDTQRTILLAAQKLFASKSYDRATIRDIASAAAVDPALVMHYFGTKQELFVEAMLPLSKTPQQLPGILAGEPERRGERFAQLMSQIFSDGETTQFLTAIVRAAASEPNAAVMVRDFIGLNLISPTAKGLPQGDAELRASLIGAQVIGIVMMKYIVQAEPLASASPADIEKVLGPLIQQYFNNNPE